MEDVTANVVTVSARWRNARQSRRDVLVRLEEEGGFEDVQRFLDTVHVLSSSGRLSRLAFLARKRL